MELFIIYSDDLRLREFFSYSLELCGYKLTQRYYYGEDAFDSYDCERKNNGKNIFFSNHKISYLNYSITKINLKDLEDIEVEKIKETISKIENGYELVINFRNIYDLCEILDVLITKTKFLEYNVLLQPMFEILKKEDFLTKWKEKKAWWWWEEDKIE